MNNDLISREALKEEFDIAFFNDYDDYKKSLRIIDNAPTVCKMSDILINRDEFKKYYCKLNCGEKQCVDYADRCSFIDELMQFKTEPERQQGEWAEIEGGYICSNCEDIEAYTPNFCPNCGAEMKGGAV